MRQKVIISIMIVFIGAVVAIIVFDLFKKSPQTVNPYEYKVDEFKKIDEAQVGYKEINRITPTIQKLNSIAIDENDNVYLSGLQKVMLYNSELAFQSGFKVEGEAKAMAVSPQGLIYLGFENHVEVWTNEANKIAVWEPYNDRSYITSIAIKSDQIFVADAGNKLVLKYNNKGILQKEIGKKDSASRPKSFIIPSPYFDLLIGRQGALWVVNPGLHQFEAYNENGELFSSWKRTSMHWDGFSGCCNPTNIAILSDGSFVTSEKGLVRIKVHAPNGDFKCAVAIPKDFGQNTTGIDLAVDSKDRIYAIVPNAGELRVYDKK